jgi:hypothetical protein
VVTYPAYQYGDLTEATQVAQLAGICAKLKAIGFRYVVVVCAFPVQEALQAHLPAVDILLGYAGTVPAELISAKLHDLWWQSAPDTHA